MSKISILDCTLRDGGYVNTWDFGEKNIERILENLIEANIEIIECGFLRSGIEQNNDLSLFRDIKELDDLIPLNKDGRLFVCMINYGEYEAELLPDSVDARIDGIRVAFHKKDALGAIELCRQINKKGYKVFLQPMVTKSYTDKELLSLIDTANELKLYAFYIVDSFGVMKRSDLLKLFYLVDYNLDANIILGYHSHNNIQLAFSNAQIMLEMKTNRDMIIDSSVFGMGRGAGNLNTELIIELLNNEINKKYVVSPLLKIMDEVLNPIYKEKYWGYSLPHYISAKHDCHPNYASYLSNKNTLLINDIDKILYKLSENRKDVFDKNYAEKLYLEYQAHTSSTNNYADLREEFSNKTVIIIAPGKSIYDETKKIENEQKNENTITVAVNFVPENLVADYIFISNIRRFEALDENTELKIIATTNIEAAKNRENISMVEYETLLNDHIPVKDNASLMLIKLLILLGAKNVKLAGMDGYSHGSVDDYISKEMIFFKTPNEADETNQGIERVLKEYYGQVCISFLTKEKFIRI